MCGPRISAHALPLDGELDFYFKRVNKIRKKTLSVTPYFRKGGLRKIRSGSGIRLLIGKVR